MPTKISYPHLADIALCKGHLFHHPQNFQGLKKQRHCLGTIFLGFLKKIT